MRLTLAGLEFKLNRTQKCFGNKDGTIFPPFQKGRDNFPPLQKGRDNLISPRSKRDGTISPRSKRDEEIFPRNFWDEKIFWRRENGTKKMFWATKKGRSVPFFFAGRGTKYLGRDGDGDGNDEIGRFETKKGRFWVDAKRTQNHGPNPISVLKRPF